MIAIFVFIYVCSILLYFILRWVEYLMITTFPRLKLLTTDQISKKGMVDSL